MKQRPVSLFSFVNNAEENDDNKMGSSNNKETYSTLMITWFLDFVSSNLYINNVLFMSIYFHLSYRSLRNFVEQGVLMLSLIHI